MSLIDDYLASFRRKADSTKRDRRYVLRKFERWLGKPLDQVEPSNVEDWMDEMVDDGMKASAINQELSVIKNLYGWFISELPIPVETSELRDVLLKQKRFNKIVAVERLESGGAPERAWSERELKTLLSASEKEPDIHRIIFLGGYFGLRRDELRLLRKDDVDFRRNEIRIRREITKTQAGVRRIPFHPAVTPYLISDEYIIGGEEPYSRSFYYGFWRRFNGLLGFHLRCKQMRVSFDTWMGEALDPVLGKRNTDYILKKLMGHKTKGTADMTEHYRGETKKLEEDLRKAMVEYHYFKSWGVIR